MVAKTSSFRNPGRGEALLAPCALALCLLFPAVAGGTDPVFELGSLLPANGGDGSAGFLMAGLEEDDRLGSSVGAAGDFNHDGIDDLIVGASWGDGAASDSGATYVVFGRTTGFAPIVDLGTLDGSNGVAINGIGVGDMSGYSANGAGDVNGDGIDDVIIGAWSRGSAGRAYVVYGRAGGFTSPIQLSGIDGSNGFEMLGQWNDTRFGFAVDGAGDINGDGVDDVIVGAARDVPFMAGQGHVVFGRAGGLPSPINVSDLNGFNGFSMLGYDIGALTGWSVGAAGDVNGDGLDDVIAGAPLHRDRGVTFLVYGSTAGFPAEFDLGPYLDGRGFRIWGADALDLAGYSVGGAGDVNGDGVDDLVIGAVRGDANGTESGEAYAVYGKRGGGFPPTLPLATLQPPWGSVLNGPHAEAQAGWSVSGVGDVNGDGFDDLIVGAPETTVGGHQRAGASYVVFGRVGDLPHPLELTQLDGENGYALWGAESFEYIGAETSGAGDVNGDGVDDLVIGTPFAQEDRGICYVVFGRQEVDLAIEKLASAQVVPVGGSLSYTLLVSNLGVATAADVQVLDTLPVGLGFVDAGGSGWSCASNEATVTCDLVAPLPEGAAPQLDIQVTALETGAWTNAAAVASKAFDPDGANSLAEVSVQVVGAVAVPALAPYGLLGLILALGAAGVAVLRANSTQLSRILS